MTLQEIYDSEDLEMRLFDLEKTVDMINDWLDGGEVDPYLAHYAGMLLLSLSQHAPELEKQ